MRIRHVLPSLPGMHSIVLIEMALLLEDTLPAVTQVFSAGLDGWGLLGNGLAPLLAARPKPPVHPSPGRGGRVAG
jgi:hypothetical protein